MPSSQNWNDLVAPENRLESPNKNSRRPSGLKPSHIVIHITGTDSLASVRETFLAPNSVSAHYLITKIGELFQFAPDTARAWHAGIDSSSRRLYRKGVSVWSQYLKYFSWYKKYPKDCILLDGDARPVWDRSEAVFVAKKDWETWSEFEYFTSRWAGEQVPVHFGVDPDPNNYSIGIEIMGLGSTTADPSVYTDQMYRTLDILISDLSEKYSIPKSKDHILGHEDVHPIGRFGWDPAGGFNWSVVRGG